MKAEEALTSPLVNNGVNGVSTSGGGPGSGFSVFGKSRYKFWALAGILLLALWSMFTGTVTLKWSTGNLNPLSDRFDSPIHNDLDVLELEEREKLVRQMWDVYTQSKTTRLPSFWLEAFEAAYEELSSDVPDARNAAVSEIARMTLRTISIEPLTVQSMSTREARTTSKQAEKGRRRV